MSSLNPMCNDQKIAEPNISFLYYGLGAVVFLWLLSAIVIPCMTKWPDEPGTFGDMFGAVNALFSGLAFATIIFTAWMQRSELALQREELALQRKEMELNRKELQGQKEQMELQNETFAIQRFENTFFELLRAHVQILSSISLIVHTPSFTRGGSPATVKKEAYQCFEIFVNVLKQEATIKIADSTYANDPMYIIDPILGEVDRYSSLHKSYGVILDRYFRHLYHIIKFVKSSSINNKKTYTNFVRAQLSSNELLLLFYNCHSDYGREKFKPLIEEFSLLKGLPVEELISPEHKQFYKPSAYGEK